MSLTISPQNDATLAVLVTTPGDVGRSVPATGLSMIGFLSTSSAFGATAIHASLSVTMVEQPAGSGYYQGNLPGSALETQWSSLLAAASLYVHYKAGTVYHEVDIVLRADVRTPGL